MQHYMSLNTVSQDILLLNKKIDNDDLVQGSLVG